MYALHMNISLSDEHHRQKNKLFEVYYKKFSTMTVFFDNTFSYGNTYNDIKERFKSSLKRENFNSC